MANILLDYAVPFSQVESLPPPSMGFLHRIGVIVPTEATMTESQITLVTDPTELAALTAHSEELKGFFDGGGSQMYVINLLAMEDLEPLLEGKESDFYTLYAHTSALGLLPSALTWTGVKSTSQELETGNFALAATDKTCIFASAGDMANYNPLYAFGKLMSSASWRNQQYISTSVSDGAIDTLGAANTLFDERVSFFIEDSEHGNRLGFFVAGGQSITTPYISKEVEMNMQYAMTNFITVNQPFNTSISRADLERVGNKLLLEYVERGYLDADKVNKIVVTDSPEAFVVSGNLTTSPAVALWRVRMDAYQTQG